MNEKIKNIWQKVKEFFKKNWLYIATFFAGVIASISIILSRLSGQPTKRSDDIGNTLDELRDGLTETGDKVSELRDGNADAIQSVDRQREQISDIRDGHNDIEDSSREIGQSISRIKELIEAERKRIEENEITE